MLCCWKSCIPHHSFPCSVVYFLLLLSLDLSDFICDWLFYYSVKIQEVGLVYGPPEDAVIHALLAFCIIGTITFIFETLNLWWEVFRENPWFDADLVSALTIWLEDLPQVAISFYIAWCREDPISVFQLVKASFVLIDLFVRIIMGFVKYCNKKALEEANQKTTKSNLHVTYRVLIMLALIINTALAIGIFILTQTQKGPRGDVKFQVPETVFEDKYDYQKYFQNVSIFAHHPEFDVNPPTSSNFRANWVRFMSINDIRDRSNVELCFNYVYEKNATHQNMAIFLKEEKAGRLGGTWNLSECYSIELASNQSTSVSPSTCLASFSTQARSIYLTFIFISPDGTFPKYLFGDIKFNTKTYKNQSCDAYVFNTSDTVKADPLVPTIRYFRVDPGLAPEKQHHLLLDPATGVPRFYKNDDEDLQDIGSVWKTGWGKCQSSGSLAPNFQDTINVRCSNPILAVAGSG